MQRAAAKRGDRRRIVTGFEDRRAGNDGVRSGVHRPPGMLAVLAAIHLDNPQPIAPTASTTPTTPSTPTPIAATPAGEEQAP